MTSICAWLIWWAASALLRATAPEPVDVGDRRQLLLDGALFERADRVSFRVHAPEPREVAVRCDRPWERKVLHYSSVVYDQGRYRMWYRVDEGDPHYSPTIGSGTSSASGSKPPFCPGFSERCE